MSRVRVPRLDLWFNAGEAVELVWFYHLKSDAV